MKRLFIPLLLLIFFGSMQAQNFTISGYVEDQSSGERLLNANVYNPQTLQGVITNNYGFYSLTISSDSLQLTYSYIGYQSQTIQIDLKKDTLINVLLVPVINIDEVVISAEKAKSTVRSTQISMTELSAKEIKSIPVLFGEVDVLKALQLLPGVQSGNEGTSGIYVRGGGPDQNLILLDGVPVYNANHLFGFFSVFNPDAIQSVKLIKGGFPARYGGRLSSVLDIRMKDGNNKKFAAEGSVGVISSKLTVEGPIWKDKTSFIVSGRRTYIDMLAQPLIQLNNQRNDLGNSVGGYYFYDVTAKVNHRFSDKSRLYLSSYLGRDKAYLRLKDEGADYIWEDDFGLGWGNQTTALRWNYVITPKLFSNTTVTYSKYNFNVAMETQETERDTLKQRFAFAYDSGIRDLAGKVDFDYLPNPNHSVKFGYNHIYHTFSPGVTIFQIEEESMANPVDTTFGNTDITANEMELYLEDDWELGTRFKVNLGLHASGFMVEDSSYYSLQPRVAARFMVNEKMSLKAAYSHMTQYIHLLTNSTIGLPTDLWVPSTALIKPQRSIQYALGVVYEISEGIEISMEGYYKTMNNLIEYKEGASFFSMDGDWEDKLEFGEGKAYGFEFLARKQYGKTSGWIGYTLSWSNRRFENISFGEWFPYRYDRRHDISIVLNKEITDNINLGVTWVYGTGNAVTLPLEKYASMSSFWNDFLYFNQVDYFEKRNSYRMPAYHRLDIGINFNKEKKWGHRTWSISVYNAYNRKNPFFLNFDQIRGASGYSETVLKQYSLFPIIPSLSYSFKIK
jgi:outer membrane receptor for ferrienterochelin and colicin